MPDMTTQTPDAVREAYMQGQVDMRERAAQLCDQRGAEEQEGFGLVRGTQNYFRARNAIRDLEIAALDSRAGDAGEEERARQFVERLDGWRFYNRAEFDLALFKGAQLIEAMIGFARSEAAATPAPAVDAVPAGEVERRTDAEIVEQTNDLARQFYARRGYEVPGGYRFDRATHPHEVEAWDMACMAMEALTDTDAQSVADDLADAALSHGEGRK